MMAYRSFQYDSTKFTQNMFMLGREVGLPLDVVEGSPGGQQEDLEVHEYVDGLRTRIERTHEFARCHLQRQLQRHWEGPFAVLECINDVTYKIQK